MPERDLFGEVPAKAPRSQTGAQSSQPRHTWFFALRPSADDALRIHACAETLLVRGGITGRRISPERLHITLELVGHDMNEATVESACAAADTVRFHAVNAQFDATMTFSAPSGPFVLLGGAGLDEVRALRTALGYALAHRGFNPSRTYEPHMTLSYAPRHRTARAPVEPIGFLTNEFALVKSHIGFSRHEVLRTWPLNART